MSVSDVLPFYLRFARLTYFSGACRGLLFGVLVCVLFIFPLFGLFCKCPRCFDKFL